ncbi:hypothetical protein MtrunA17_Chr3g0091751 [Medicago truncatula]|uniref:Uncharacterized protein n=1 Tax=Medicago truncatula TaxID=3880 RepID=A0A396IL96_MEDTR|nr:hypothetical protein MtrunA17_Chr3g0091751 [Medicago truncatula]
MCRCGRMRNQENGVYLCDLCNLTTFNICCKCRLRILVNDRKTTARFQMFDYVLDEIKSLDYSTQACILLVQAFLVSDVDLSFSVVYGLCYAIFYWFYCVFV